MADFRKWIIVLFVLTLFAGLGTAQTIPGNSNMVCNFSQTPTLPIRNESYTDATSDIIIGCVGGQNLAVGTPIPQATITVTLNAPVTSRLIASGDKYANASEALLIIDEPGANLPVLVPGYGTGAPQILCSTAGIGCAGVVGSGTIQAGFGALSGLTVPIACQALPCPTVSTMPNVYQGVVSGSSVTFFGVPVLPPGTSNVQRTFRITNVRISSAGFSPAVGNVNAVLANVASNNALPLATPTDTVGYVQTSMASSLSYSSSAKYATYLQCLGNPISSSASASTNLVFKELFSSAFKTRVVPLSNTSYAGQATNGSSVGVTQQPGSLSYTEATGQSTPGALFAGNPINTNSESDFIFPIGSGGCTSSSITACAGLADFGTRLKAVFTNIPSGVSVYVAITNTPPASSTPPTPVGGTSITSYAQLVSSELAPEVTAAATGNVSFGGTANAVQIPVVNGSAEAVWEVINANPNAIDTFSFPVYFAVAVPTSTVAAATAPSSAFVAMSYAPTPDVNGPGSTSNFSATGANVAQGYGYPIPRFQDAVSPLSALQINICQTALLWPYVVTGQVLGFETGIAVSNTTMDPFGSPNQTGSCNLWWYGQNYNSSGAVASATVTPITYGCDQAGAVGAAACVGITGSKVIAPGQTWASTAGNLQAVPANNYWLGYVIGVCNFQYAHGYAAITDIGVRNIISSYLALVMEGPGGFLVRAGAPMTQESLDH